MTGPIVLCETPSGCSCGAPASTPAGMHHAHCGVNPGQPDSSGCRVCKIPPSTVVVDPVCITCGPTTLEEHPRNAGVLRCSNCKEWLGGLAKEES